MELKIIEKDGKIYSHVRKKWLAKTPEELVRQEYLLALINKYGYAIDQIKEEENVTGRASAQARADFIIYKNKHDIIKHNNPLIIVECKADHINISEKDYVQGEIYARIYNAPFFVTHNNKETRYWKVKKDKSPGYREEIKDIPKANATEKEIHTLLTELITFKEGEFKKVLKQCHDIIYQNEKADPVFAFDEIAKILFMKVYAERHLKAEKENVFSLEWVEQAEKFNPDYINDIFEKTKVEFGKGAIFKENEKINLDKHTIKSIIKKLEKYYLSATSADIKGIAFEGFLGDTFRSDNGQFFTPRTIVEAMINIINPQPNQLVCDPACGSGGFLIRYFQEVQNKILLQLDADYQKKKNEIEKNTKLTDEEKTEQIFSAFKETEALSDITNTKSPLFHLANRCIFGSDANERMARTSKMNMIMHGDGHGGIKHQNGFKNIDEIRDHSFDCVITNPPFGSIVNDKEILENYTLPHKNPIKEEFLFIERGINLLKEGGKMGIVLPESIFNNVNCKSVREYVENNTKIDAIISLPQMAFKNSGADIKCSLLFITKFTNEEKIQWDSILENEGRDIAKLKFNYKIFISEVEKVGYTTIGGIDKNFLPDVVSDYFTSTSNTKIKHKFSQIIEYKNVSNRWDVKSFVTHSSNIDNHLLKELKEFSKPFRKLISKDDAKKNKYRIIKKITQKGELHLRDLDEIDSYKGQLFLVPPNSFIFSKINASKGCFYYHSENFYFVVSSEYPTIQFNNHVILGEYVQIAIRFGVGTKILNSQAAGMAKPRIKLSDLMKLQIPVPSIEEQKEKMNKLLAALEEKKRIDEQINNIQNQLEKYFTGDE